MNPSFQKYVIPLYYDVGTPIYILQKHTKIGICSIGYFDHEW